MSEHTVNLLWKNESEDFSYKNYDRTHSVYSGEMDHVIPRQTEQVIIWRTYIANAVKAFLKVVI
jgi:hypothetical protein